jgi:hypothetical protein
MSEYENEAAVKKEIKKRLKKVGWMWIDTSQPTGAYQQMKDVPDMICFRRDHTVLLEVKSRGGQPTEGQWEWRAKIGPHLGFNLHHMFIYHPDGLPRWMTKPIGGNNE